MGAKDDSPLPDGSFDFVKMKSFSDEDADYMANWMAIAFSKTDCFAYMVIGKTYDEDPEAHRLFRRASIDRGCIEGIQFVNKSFTAIRTVFLPGARDRRLDADWITHNDTHWQKFLDHVGGSDYVKARLAKMFPQVDAELLKLYGESCGLEFYKTGGFAVHPAYQGRGIGSALHQHIAKEARAADKKCYFLSQEYMVPFYQKVGCEIVGTPIPTGLDEHGRQHYLTGYDFARVCEVNP